ncbi:flagellar brake domain-containing protein [Lysinibacillus sp. KU-BSD001]|uniref:flagellar brake protein n=1 Tax=Lysinibacillus sp. KU-BSD001 TaxID=3141328 RepID=UPI0036E91D86
MELKIGTMLILEPTYTERLEKFRCKVLEQTDGVIYIDYPVNTITKKTAFLIDGAQFRVTFNNESKQSFAFNTEVLGRKAGNIPMIMLAYPQDEEVIKIQRREYVRVETPVDIAVEYDGVFTQFIAADISAGGVLLNLREAVNFSDGDTVHLTIVLPYMNGEIRYVQTDALVVRIFERDERTFASMQFTDTDDLDKQYVVRFCFERQLQIRKKELNESL